MCVVYFTECMSSWWYSCKYVKSFSISSLQEWVLLNWSRVDNHCISTNSNKFKSWFCRSGTTWCDYELVLFMFLYKYNIHTDVLFGTNHKTAHLWIQQSPEYKSHKKVHRQYFDVHTGNACKTYVKDTCQECRVITDHETCECRV